MDSVIFKGLTSFVKNNSNAKMVVQGLQNRSTIEEDCAIITFLNKTIEGTPISLIEFDYDVEMVGSQVLANYQLDLYGENAYDNISRLRTLFSYDVGIKFFREYNFAPVMTTSIRNLTANTIINEQYVKRYSMDLQISYRDYTAIEVEFYDEINLTTMEVANADIYR